MTEQLLKELIALPSVNPAFMPEGDSRAGEARVADFLTSKAASMGFDVEQQPVFPKRSNLLFRMAPTGRIRSRVILAPHMDTVGHAGMPDSLFRPVKKNGRLYGRGACDTKGSVAAMLSAMEAVAASGRRPASTEVVLAALIDEENAQEGSRALMKSGFRGDLAIIGEPTCLEVITAHKGDVWLFVRTRGKAAHGSRPELGKNAVHAMAQAVHLIETRYAREIARHRHPILGKATVNVGTIRGGTQPNIVPDFCEISVDRRTIPGETEIGVRREIAALLKANGIDAEILDQKRGLPCWPMETRATLPLVRQLMSLAGQKKPAGVHYFSDASVFARAGVPAILLGPGDIAQAHTIDEWISLRSLEGATALLTRFLRSLA